MITVADLQAISGSRTRSRVPQQMADAFNQYAAEYGIIHQHDIADFLAHISVETGGFRKVSESLNYSADALKKMFGRHRISVSDANRYGRAKGQKANQVMIANLLYGGSFGRKHLGNTQKDDGWAYRGSGPGQVTGRANFRRAEQLTGLPFLNTPDLMRDPENGMIATMALWKHWDMNKFRGGSRASRKKWNGGSHGLAQYQAAFARAMKRRLSVPEMNIPIPDTKPETAPLPADIQPEIVEDALRKDGSRTIQNADEVESGSIKRFLSFIATNVGAIASYIQGIDWKIIAIIAAVGLIVYAIYEWRSYKAAQAIKQARVDDAITGKHIGRVGALEAAL